MAELEQQAAHAQVVVIVQLDRLQDLLAVQRDPAATCGQQVAAIVATLASIAPIPKPLTKRNAISAVSDSAAAVESTPPPVSKIDSRIIARLPIRSA